jgi:hypothetical protein
MKRIFTLIFGLSAALVASSQHKQNVNGDNLVRHTPRKATNDERRLSIEAGQNQSVMINTLERGSAFFTEDFANGFDGNNPFGFWTFEDSGNNSIWMMADENSPAGAYSDPAEALESTTADNGWVIFDCDLYQGGEIDAVTNPAEDVTGYFTSPEINLSTAASAVLQFEQTFRYCCQDDKPLWVEVTNDGGNSWYAFDAAPDFTGGANDASDNPYLTQVDISGVAAYQSNVQFRFAWQPNGNATHSHYFWGIDDVSIISNPIENDMELAYLALGDVAGDFEFRVIPLEQARPDGMILGTVYSNIGTNPHNATITVEILDAAQAQIASWSEDLEVLPNSLLPNPTDPFDTLLIETGWIPTETGTYFARTTISSAETDDTPANNTLTRKFFVTAAEYGHDDPSPGQLNSQMEPIGGAGTVADPYPPTGFGSYLSVYNPGSTAYGLMVRFDNITDDNAPITISLLKQADDYNLTDAEFVTGGEYDVLPSWTPNAVQSFPVYIPFETIEGLDEESLYFVGIQTIDEGTDALAVQARIERDADFSTGTWAETTEGDFIWFFGLGTLTNFTPAIRLALDDLTSVEELSALAGLESFQINPNPVVNTANIQFNLDGPHYVAYEVRDITGKLMGFKNLGQFTGTNNYSVDVSHLSAGNYMLNLVIDGEHIFTQKMNVTKP